MRRYLVMGLVGLAILGTALYASINSGSHRPPPARVPAAESSAVVQAINKLDQQGCFPVDIAPHDVGYAPTDWWLVLCDNGNVVKVEDDD